MTRRQTISLSTFGMVTRIKFSLFCYFVFFLNVPILDGVDQCNYFFFGDDYSICFAKQKPSAVQMKGKYIQCLRIVFACPSVTCLLCDRYWIEMRIEWIAQATQTLFSFSIFSVITANQSKTNCDERTNLVMNDGWIDGWMDGWKNKQTNHALGYHFFLLKF